MKAFQKTISTILAIILCVSSLAGCGAQTPTESTVTIAESTDSSSLIDEVSAESSAEAQSLSPSIAS